MDQAARLRKLVEERKVDQIRVDQKKTARIISVTSGKGGVGKTSLSVNLAAHLSKQGTKILLIDADLGLSNVEIMLGVTPSYTLKDVIKHGKDIEDVIINGPYNLDFISGGNGFLELAELSEIEREEILIKIHKLEELYDIIIIDTGAGISKNVTAFLTISDEIIVITTSEPTALTDAYSIMKVISEEKLKQKIGLIINRVKTKSEFQQASNILISTAKKFLGEEIKSLGYVYEDPNVRKTIYKKTPFVIYYPDSKASDCIIDIVANLKLKEKPDKKISMMDKFMRLFETSR
ncbi:MAG: MinD/ParA family protein [Fusobacteriaceae bacterium]|nr:MinD/ParA family protein [Fusobacteriaceae bacterium]MBP6466492.1 MinD/ParA family protein [Fusobacteriaceae bacterium]MBP9595319.1 MinD/ParA family protein [Fusobacteriaceae bacterium]MBU9916916.1 MinD/ParA family protein [Fusobacteriaceae bacterium]